MTQPKGREGSILAVVVDETANSIVFNVKGAAPEGGSKSLTLEMAKLSPEVIAYAALHGMKQRISDMAALSRNPETGKPATPLDKFEALERGVLHYMTGTAEWNLRSTGEGRTDGELSLLTRAICELKKKETPAVREWLKTKSAAERRALAISDSIKPLIDSYRAEMAGDVDAESLMAELS